MSRFLPTKTQWKDWSLPSKYTALGLPVGLLALVLTLPSLWPTGDAAKQQARHSEVMQELRNRNKSRKDELWDRYPFGYVLFGSVDGDVVCLPFYKGDLFVEAKWERTQIEADYTRRQVRVTIAQPKWKQDAGATIRVTVAQEATVTFPLKIREPMPFNIVRSPNQPQMLFEVLDDNQRNPVYVIGFRKSR